MRPLRPVRGVGALVLAAPLGLAQGAIATGDARFAWTSFGPAETQAGFADLVTQASGPAYDHLRQHWIFWRAAGGAAEAPLPPPTSEAYASDPGVFELRWDAHPALPFDAVLTGALASPAPSQAVLVETLELTNPGDAPLSVTVLAFAELDVADVFGGFPDTAALVGPERVRVDDHGTVQFAELASPSAAALEADDASALHDGTLLDGGPDDLSNDGLPFGPGTFGGAFQHHVHLAPGASVALPVLVSANAPAVDPDAPAPAPPPTAPLAGFDLVGVAWSGVAAHVDAQLGAGPVLGPTLWDEATAAGTDPAGVVHAAAGGTLIRVDPATGAGAYVAPLGVEGVRGLAFSPAGELLALARDPVEGDRLVRLDPAGGGAQVVGPTGLVGLEALAFDAEGGLVAWHAGDGGAAGLGLVRVDAATGAAHDPFPAVGATADVRALALGFDGRLYAARHALHVVDPATGATSELGGGAWFDLGGLAAAAAPAGLASDAPSVSLSAGGTQTLALAGGPFLAGHAYVVGGSAAGTAPGLALGPLVAPLVPDAYLALTLGSGSPLDGGQGVLGATGEATAEVVVPAGTSPALAGLTLHHAYAALDPAGSHVSYASDAVPLVLAP